jgi:hypothetical protein
MYRLNTDVFRSSRLVYWISSDCVHRRVDSLRTSVLRFYRNVKNIFSVGSTSFLFSWCALPLSYAALFIQHYSYFSACPLHQFQGPNSSFFSSSSILLLLPLKQQHLFRLASPRFAFFSIDTGNLRGEASLPVTHQMDSVSIHFLFQLLRGTIEIDDFIDYISPALPYAVSDCSKMVTCHGRIYIFTVKYPGPLGHCGIFTVTVSSALTPNSYAMLYYLCLST